MEQAAVSAAVSPGPPTETNPEFGYVVLNDVDIAEVVHWVDDDHHVFRSTEFDLVVGDPDEDAAASKFLDSTIDRVNLLIELERSGEIAENEQQALNLLLPRVYEAFERAFEQDRRKRRQRKLSLLGRRRGDHPHGGFHRSQPPSSSRPVPA